MLHRQVFSDGDNGYFLRHQLFSAVCIGGELGQNDTLRGIFRLPLALRFLHPGVKRG